MRETNALLSRVQIFTNPIIQRRPCIRKNSRYSEEAIWEK
jgi:hypothetical protein